MISAAKQRLFRLALNLSRGTLSLAGSDGLQFAGEELIKSSGLGLGRYPVGFRPEEVEIFAPDAGTQMAAVRDYEEAMSATDCDALDNLAKRGRFFKLHQMLQAAYDRLGPSGDIAECGCWRGQSTYMLALIAERSGATDFHVFDSFEGLSEFGEKDAGGLAPKSESDAQARQKLFAADEESVRSNLSRFPFVSFYKGWIPERFSEIEDRQFKFVHIDVDLYQPYVDSIEFFYPRLLEGGILAFDDCGSAGFPGARRAVEELEAKFKPRMFLQFPLGGGAWFK
jgi:O-methyltransferase